MTNFNLGNWWCLFSFILVDDSALLYTSNQRSMEAQAQISNQTRKQKGYRTSLKLDWCDSKFRMAGISSTKLLKDSFVVQSSAQYPSIETYNNGFIVAYYSSSNPYRVYTIILDSSYNVESDSPLFLNILTN